MDVSPLPQQPPQSSGSGSAPSYPLPRTEVFSVEYPGYVKSESNPKAVHRLGGDKTITEAFRKGLNIDIKLHDDDKKRYWAHRPVGQAASTQNLLMKVVKRKRKDKEGDTLGEFTIELVGRIPRTVRFRGPADFQYQPPNDDPVVRLRDAMESLDYKGVMEYKIPQEKEDYTIDPVTQAEQGLSSSSNLRMMPPPIWSRYTIPLNYQMKPNPSSVPEVVVDPRTGEEYTRMTHSRKRRLVSMVVIAFDQPTPFDPPVPPNDESKPKQVVLERIQQLFEERPVWTKIALVNQLSDAEAREVNVSKNILPYCGYFFSDGPFRDGLVRFGYDPRTDANAAIYQCVGVRNMNRIYTRGSLTGAKEVSEGSSSKDKLSHIFDGMTVGTGHASILQLCDITDPVLRPFIENGNRRRNYCHDYDGWYTAATMERIRSLLKLKFQRLLDGGGPMTREDLGELADEDDGAASKQLAAMREANRAGTRQRRKRALGPEELAAQRLRRAVGRLDPEL